MQGHLRIFQAGGPIYRFPSLHFAPPQKAPPLHPCSYGPHQFPEKLVPKLSLLAAPGQFRLGVLPQGWRRGAATVASSSAAGAAALPPPPPLRLLLLALQSNCRSNCSRPTARSAAAWIHLVPYIIITQGAPQ